MSDDYRWLTSPRAQQYWLEAIQDPGTKSATLAKRLRSQLPSNHASLLLEQVELQSLAKRKVPDPANWFWTRQLLEQSSDFETAFDTALDFPTGCRVMDVCCGAGADAVALANRGLSVTAVDRCPIACELVRHNATSHGLAIEVLEGTAEAIQVDPELYIHIDPDRRADGSRTSSLERLSPSWETILKLLLNCRGMSMKLAPGTRVDWTKGNHPTERPPEAVRFLSKDGSVRQQRWYWGLERWPAHSITASMQLNAPSTRRALLFEANPLTHPDSPTRSARMSNDWFHETFRQHEMVSGSPSFTSIPLAFVGDYDPSIRAAELSVCFANRYGWQLIDSDSGYLTSIAPTTHPMVRWFQVVDVLPLDNKRIKSYARTQPPKTWELKSRGLEVDLNALRKILPCDSNSARNMTIFCTKLAGNHRAIFCEECAIH